MTNQTIKESGEIQSFEDLVIKKPASSSQEEPVLASYLTHELRAPVTAIRLGLEILQEQVDDRLAADERQMLTLAIKNTNRLQGLVNDIMDYTKIMAGKMGLNLTPCDARALAAEAIDGIQSWAIAKGIRLTKREGEPLPRILAEPRRIIQILTNLISNAIKFTPIGGDITVSVKEGTGEHAGTLVFKVQDTGCGIPKKNLIKIFDTFNQSVESGKQGEGTGLGLTLARSMVAVHNGRIWAESSKGRGSAFYFTIPVTPEDMPEKLVVYPKPIEFHGVLVNIYRRLNAFIAAFV